MWLLPLSVSRDACDLSRLWCAMSLTLDAAGVSEAATEELLQWKGVLIMCQREGAARMGEQWLKNAKVGLPLIEAELRRRARCPKCQTALLPGQALEQTYKPGVDYDPKGGTMMPGGTGKLIEVWKCPKCGYSRSP